jgi:hypothetical protein
MPDRKAHHHSYKIKLLHQKRRCDLHQSVSSVSCMQRRFAGNLKSAVMCQPPSFTRQKSMNVLLLQCHVFHINFVVQNRKPPGESPLPARKLVTLSAFRSGIIARLSHAAPVRRRLIDISIKLAPDNPRCPSGAGTWRRR